MKQMMKAAGLALAIALGASVTQAQDIKPYAGIGVGGFDFRVSVLGANDSGSSAGYFGILGADIGDYFGVEFRGGVTSKAQVFGLNYKLNNFFSYFAKLQLPSDDGQIKLYGLLGGTTAKLTTSGGYSSGAKTGFSYGAGVDYKFNDKLSIAGEWVRYWHTVTLIKGVGEATVSGLSATLDYHF